MPLEPPRISVIMPAYNAAAFIRRGLLTVLSQSESAFEIIVVDDGSTDGTTEVVRDYAPQVHVIRQPNAGPGAARNRGAQVATGDWLAFLDADDAWRPCKLERQRPALDDSADVIFSHVVGPQTCDKPAGSVNFDRLWTANCIGMSTAIVRRSTFLDLGGFDEDRVLIGIEDYNFWLRLAARGGRFTCVPEPLVEYTPAPGNLSSHYWRLAAGAAENVRRVAALAQLSHEQLRDKLAEVYAEYGLALLHRHDLVAARKCLRLSLRERPSRRLALRWLTTFAPRPVFEWRRQIVTSLFRHVS